MYSKTNRKVLKKTTCSLLPNDKRMFTRLKKHAFIKISIKKTYILYSKHIFIYSRKSEANILKYLENLEAIFPKYW